MTAMEYSMGLVEMQAEKERGFFAVGCQQLGCILCKPLAKVVVPGVLGVEGEVRLMEKFVGVAPPHKHRIVVVLSE